MIIDYIKLKLRCFSSPWINASSFKKNKQLWKHFSNHRNTFQGHYYSQIRPRKPCVFHMHTIGKSLKFDPMVSKCFLNCLFRYEWTRRLGNITSHGINHCLKERIPTKKSTKFLPEQSGRPIWILLQWL